MRQNILLLFVVLLFVSACASQPTPAPAAPTPGIPEPTQEQEPVITPTQPPIEAADPAIEKLFEKSGSVKSYSFDAAVLPTRLAHSTYYVRGDKAKVTLSNPALMNGWSADVVYLDFTKKTAMAYCITLASCKKDKLSAPVTYETYAIKLPLEWKDEILKGTKGRTVQFNNRPVEIVTWQSNGRYYDAYVDPFYGFPQRVQIANDAEMTDIVGGYDYLAMAYNNVKAEDVTAPY